MSENIVKEIKKEWIQQLKEGKLYCGLCFQKIERISDITYDHWMPKSLGGPTNRENGVPAHPWCNSAKSNIHPDVFEAHREEILSRSYHLTDKYSLKPKTPVVQYQEPKIIFRNGQEIQVLRKRSHPKNPKNLNRKEQKKKERQKLKTQKKKNRQKIIKYTLPPQIMEFKTITIGQTIGEIKETAIGSFVKYESVEYVVIGFIDGKPIARELYLDENGVIQTRLVTIKKPLTPKQAKVLSNMLNNQKSR